MDWQQLVDRCRAVLEPLPYAHAAWLSGSVAFGRLDAWSDVDLCVISDDPEAIFTAIEAAFPTIDLKWRLPEPTWHGHAQCFYRFSDASPCLLLDLSVQATDSPQRFLDPVRHGTPVVLFDPQGAVHPGPSDGKPANLDEMRVRAALFAPFVDKALARGDLLEALHWYQGFLLRPLVQALRLVHDPERHDFHVRYVAHDLPAPVVARLQRLSFPSQTDLGAYAAEARQWLEELLGG